MSLHNPQNIDTSRSKVFATPRSGDKLVYFGMFLFLSVIISLLIYLTSQGFGNGRHISAVQVTAFILLGILNVVYLRRGQATPDVNPDIRRWWLSAAGAASIIATLIIIAITTTVYNWLLIIASAAAFLLPVTIMVAWQTYRHVPGVSSLPWNNSMISEGESLPIYKKDFDLSFNILDSTGSKSTNRPVIAGKVSRYSKVGAAFFELTNDSGKSSSGADYEHFQHDNISWTFYVRDLVLGKRWLNPELSFQQNRVVPKTIIIAQRINDKDL